VIQARADVIDYSHHVQTVQPRAWRHLAAWPTRPCPQARRTCGFPQAPGPSPPRGDGGEPRRDDVGQASARRRPRSGAAIVSESARTIEPLSWTP